MWHEVRPCCCIALSLQIVSDEAATVIGLQGSLGAIIIGHRTAPVICDGQRARNGWVSSDGVSSITLLHAHCIVGAVIVSSLVCNSGHWVAVIAGLQELDRECSGDWVATTVGWQELIHAAARKLHRELECRLRPVSWLQVMRGRVSGFKIVDIHCIAGEADVPEVRSSKEGCDIPPKGASGMAPEERSRAETVQSWSSVIGLRQSLGPKSHRVETVTVSRELKRCRSARIASLVQ